MSHRWVLLFTSSKTRPGVEKRIYEHFFVSPSFDFISHRKMHFLVRLFPDWHTLKKLWKNFPRIFFGQILLDFLRILKFMFYLTTCSKLGQLPIGWKIFAKFFFAALSLLSLVRIRARLSSLSFSSVFAFEFYCFSRNYNLSFIVAIYFFFIHSFLRRKSAQNLAF